MKKKILAMGLAVLMAVSFAAMPAVMAEEPGTKSAVMNLKHFTGDLHAAYMALKISNGMLAEGTDVTLFLNLEGVRLADLRQPQDLAWGHSTDLNGQYDAFVAAGGKVVVCPHCAMAVGLEAENLRAGARIADAKEVARLFASAGSVIDY